MTMLRSPSRGSFSDWLTTLPTTPLVIVAGVLLACLAVGVVLGMMIVGHNIDTTALGILVSFIGGMLGIGYASFRTKRMTWRPDLQVVQPPGAAPDDPLAQSDGGTLYHVHAPAYLAQQKPPPRTATAVPIPADGDGALPPA